MTYGMAATDVEQRIDFDAMRRYKQSTRRCIPLRTRQRRRGADGRLHRAGGRPCLCDLTSVQQICDMFELLDEQLRQRTGTNSIAEPVASARRYGAGIGGAVESTRGWWTEGGMEMRWSSLISSFKGVLK